MKISKSKQELARIINENGGWRDGAEWAAQCKSDVTVSFYSGCAPYRDGDCWWGDRLDGAEIKILNLMPSWHQTILSREEYFHLYPASDADGWIFFNGDNKPEFGDMVVDVKLRHGGISGCGPQCVDCWDWTVEGSDSDVIAYRLHWPEREKPEFCESVTRSIPEPSDKPTIEQLASEYRNAKDYADRKQQEADDAKADAEVALSKLEIALKELGFKIEPITAKQESGLVITDWRDLREGDEVEYVSGLIKHRNGMVGVVVGTADEGDGLNVKLELPNGECGWPTEWRFIRRP